MDGDLTVDLMVQDSRRDMVFINLVETRENYCEGVDMGRSKVLCCSCDVGREDGSLLKSDCRHTVYLKSGKDKFMEEARRMMKKGYGESESVESRNSFFASWVVVRGTRIEVGNEEEEAIIGTQLGQISRSELTRRGGNIARRWICWNFSILKTRRSFVVYDLL